MAKQIGFEVVATKPVCVDFRDGRSVSFRPGQRFKADMTNASVMRLVRTREVRKLTRYESVPPLPVKLGAPRRVQNVMKARAKIEAAKRAALAKMEASKKAPPKAEPVVDLSSPIKKKPTKKKPKSGKSDRRTPAEDK
jgi:hypothetical protein